MVYSSCSTNLPVQIMFCGLCSIQVKHIKNDDECVKNRCQAIPLHKLLVVTDRCRRWTCCLHSLRKRGQSWRGSCEGWARRTRGISSCGGLGCRTMSYTCIVCGTMCAEWWAITMSLCKVKAQIRSSCSGCGWSCSLHKVKVEHGRASQHEIACDHCYMNLASPPLKLSWTRYANWPYSVLLCWRR